MTIASKTLLLVSTGYVVFLFALAWWVDRRAARGGARWLRSPVIYTLSLSVYCTAWTFYGAVGSAARNGLEFSALYIGPTLVFVGWWWLLRKIVRIGRTHRITSIADMISSRYGKSSALAAFVTIIAVAATTPYIALQLQSVVLSYEAITGADPEQDRPVAFISALGLGLFTILFGTRSLDENERHYGVVAAIAFEAMVKLGALIAVGIYAIWFVAGGLEQTFSGPAIEGMRLEQIFGARWITVTFLSSAAIICLPRQFQVMVVENTDERHIATASWMFPAYLFLISLFILPIAAVGAATASGTNPDLFVLTLPLMRGDGVLAIIAFIGGFSATTSMVIVSTIAISTMISNHIVAPIWVRMSARGGQERSGDLRNALLNSRRMAILGILGLGYIYFSAAGRSGALAATGIIAFCGASQFLPALIAGIYWRGATKAGAIAGLSMGFVLWLWTLYLPSFGRDVVIPFSVMKDGPFGLSLLRPGSLFSYRASEPMVHSVVWSIGMNTITLVIVSIMSRMSPLERLQSALFVNVFRAEPMRAFGVVHRSATSSDLYVLAQRILGTGAATSLFRAAAIRQGKTSGLPEPTAVFISALERNLAGSIGAASAHAMMNRIAGSESISMAELVEIADENAKLRRATEALRAKSAEAEQNARELRAANKLLKTLDARKDEFLSHVSHELRTPMTSVRSFAEILEKNPGLDADQRIRFAGIIQSESQRLTRLLDEIRDLSFLDELHGATLKRVDGEAALAAAAEIALAPHVPRRATLTWEKRAGPAFIFVDPDRLAQVFINLISNAVLHNDKAMAHIELRSRIEDGVYVVEVKDNGPGVAPEDRERIFETFFRRSTAGSAGLGLPICRKFMALFGGSIELSPKEKQGARFILKTPLAR